MELGEGPPGEPSQQQTQHCARALCVRRELRGEKGAHQEMAAIIRVRAGSRET